MFSAHVWVRNPAVTPGNPENSEDEKSSLLTPDHLPPPPALPAAVEMGMAPGAKPHDL